MTKIPLIHNPVAGGGRGTIRFRKAEAMLAVKGMQVEPYATERQGHATEIALQLARDGHETIFVMGGDGTLSEAANGILQAPKGSRPKLGFLPAGTGNDFLRDFGVTSVETAVRAIGHGRVTDVDAMEATWPGGHRFAINVCGTGLIANAADRCNRQFKWLGRKGYDAAAMVELARLRPAPTKLTLDGQQRDGNYPLVVVCNSVHTGGAMKMAPGAKPTDGQLDVLVVEDAGATELLMLLATKLRAGKHVENRKVRIERAATIRIEPSVISPLMLDGDLMGQTPVEFRVLPGALQLLA